ncbi:hypothetical protein JCM11491_003226 [Sporobolomyces phaffii]
MEQDAGAKPTAAGSSAGFVPRAIKKRPPPPRSHVPPAAARLVAATSGSTTTSAPRSEPDRAAPAAPTAPVPPHHHHDAPSRPPLEVQRLELILTAIESSFSNHGLSLYRSSELFDRFRAGVQWIHLSQVLSIVPVRALTGTLVDLRDAVKLRPSHVIAVDETGYQISRKRETSLDELDAVEPADWDDLTLYFDKIPFNTSLNAIVPTEPMTFSLVRFLSAALGTTRIDKLVLPALYDPKQPEVSLTESDVEDATEDAYGREGGGESSQAEAFRASLRAKQQQQGSSGEGEMEPQTREKRRARGLPRGGGPFKGFGFVVFDDRDEVERILDEWGCPTPTAEKDDGAGEGGTEVEQSGKGKGKLEPTTSCRDKAKKGGMSAMRYSRWIELKKEYLAYRRTLETLLQAQAEGHLDRLRNPLPPDLPKDRPPHLQPAGADGAPPPPTRSSKRASSPALEPSPHPNKRAKRASSPSSTPVTRHTRKLRTPSPLPGTTDDGSGGGGAHLDLESDVALSIQGAYPQGCVVWVRNVHEKSSKTSLKALFGKLLDELQEGSGKGVEFVDYEKGLDTCYIRFSSAPLANLTESHFLSTITYHLAQPALSPVDSLSESELAQAQTDLRRPLAVEVLKGERERQYWASLPETTRRAARLGAGGKVGLVKEPRGFNGGIGSGNGSQTKVEDGTGRNGTTSNGGESGAGRNDGAPSKKRKKPSKM